ncbi:MurR/RpiR family transcriptional regulator [Mycoplasmopsis gallinacea]|uniref:MurR/RpiR family transcriptional regulator n=1 Tax=Mycoplasmopsis gallinacea TaxID=29556 RepID=A0A449A263_9BACT|nr:MurR/RpiR family transcriptional regulator [Mycoplasmopsis gallinacea]VEU58322.1 Uncharacterised protein [Mycoplasmopsis gallinacea]
MVKRSKTTNFEIFYDKLIDQSNQKETINKHIACKILKYIKDLKPIEKAIDFCDKNGISPSTFTAFCKKMGFSNVKELIFMHEQILENYKKKKLSKKDSDNKIKLAARIIDNSRKILFIGVSGALSTNIDFQLKLLRMDKNAIVVWNKYEQIGLSKLLTEKDVIIVNSVSFQHKWMIDIVKHTKAAVIVVSSWMPPEVKDKVKFFFHIKTNERQDALRVFTMQSKIFAVEIYYKIFIELQKNQKNQENLELSSYR